MAKNAIALYNTYSEAQAAVHTLEQAGFAHENISVISSGTQAHPDRPTRSPVFVGVIWGAVIGLVVGLAAIAIPQVAAFLWYGPLITLATGALIGALVGWMVNRSAHPTTAEQEAALDEDDPTRFAGDEIVSEAVRRGGTVVMVYANEADLDRAADALARHNPVQINHTSPAMREQAAARTTAAGQPGGPHAQRTIAFTKTHGARRPTAPMGKFPRRAPTIPLEAVKGQSEPVPGRSAYRYDRRGAEMGQYTNEGIDRPPLPEALDPLRDPAIPLDND